MIIQSLVAGPLGVNCYVLCDESQKRCAIVDPGGDAQRIAAVVSETGCTPCAVLLTHGHYDHTGAAAALAQQWNVPVYLNQRDVYADDLRMQQLFPLLPNTVNYDEGDTIAVGDLTVKVLATPGHSEGSVTLHCEDALFVGDTLFAGSMGRTDFPGGSTKKIMASLKRLNGFDGDCRVYPGHMESSTIENERHWNPYLQQAIHLQF